MPVGVWVRIRKWTCRQERFADEWDQKSFDPDYDKLPPEHREPLAHQVFEAATLEP